MLVLLVLPTGVLIVRAVRPAVVEALLQPAALEALRLSLVTTSLSMVLTLLLGTPVAYLLARYRFPGYRILDTLLDLPVVLPPVVAGVSLLLVFGRRGVVGGVSEFFGRQLGVHDLGGGAGAAFRGRAPLYPRDESGVLWRADAARGRLPHPRAGPLGAPFGM